MPDEYFLIALDRLCVGLAVEHPVLDESGRILLPIQSTISLDFLFACQRGATLAVNIHRSDLERWGYEIASASPKLPPEPTASVATIRRTRRVLIRQREVLRIRPELQEFAEALLSRGSTWPWAERRREFRCAAATPVNVVPLGSDGEPSGPAFEAILRDISTSGAAFLYHRALNNDQFVIELVSHRRGRVQLLFEVTRCAPAGHYFDFGGQLVACLGDE